MIVDLKKTDIKDIHPPQSLDFYQISRILEYLKVRIDELSEQIKYTSEQIADFRKLVLKLA